MKPVSTTAPAVRTPHLAATPAQSAKALATHLKALSSAEDPGHISNAMKAATAWLKTGPAVSPEQLKGLHLELGKALLSMPEAMENLDKPKGAAAAQLAKLDQAEDPGHISNALAEISAWLATPAARKQAGPALYPVYAAMASAIESLNSSAGWTP